VPWDPFLIEKLLKSEVCGSHKQCTGPTSVAEKSNIMVKKKKKKVNADTGRANAQPKRCLNE